MLKQSGLYYPYIHIRRDPWLKAAALYWNKLNRLVPYDYQTKDSYVARVLKDELDFLQDRHPGRAASVAARAFQSYLRRHGEDLSRRFGVQPSRRTGPSKLHNYPNEGAGGRTSIGYIFTQKLPPHLIETLHSLGLAFGAGDEKSGRRRISMDVGAAPWIGMDSRLAAAYMTVLAGEAASTFGSSPITDVPFAHAALANADPAVTIATLLGTLDETPSQVAGDRTQRIALLAVQTVLPSNIGQIGVKQIVAFRKKHEDDLASFQEAVLQASSDLATLDENVDAEILREGVIEVTHRHLLQPTAELEKGLKLFNIDTRRSVLTYQAPVLGSAAAFYIGQEVSSVLAGTVAAAAAYVPGFLAAESHRRQQARRESGAANYLLELRRDITPAGALRRQLRSLQ